MVRVQTALGLLIALTLPFVLEDYDLYRFTDAIVFAIAISSPASQPAPAIDDQQPVNQRMPDVPARCAAFPVAA